MFAPQHHEQLSVRWDNFHASLSHDLGALLQGGDMADVTLVADGQVLRAHRLVLALGSPYFKDALRVDPGQHPVVILKDVGYQELADVLQFMYCGEVNVQSTNLEAFLKVAEALRVKGLTEDGAFQVPKARSKNGASRESGTPMKVSRPPAKRPRMRSPAAGGREPQTPVSAMLESLAAVKYEAVPDVACDVDAGEAECFDHSSGLVFPDVSDAQSSQKPAISFSQTPQEVPQENFSFVQSRIGTPQLVHNDFIFKTHCTKGTKIYWQCTDYKKHKCRARAMTDEGRMTVMCAHHTHAPHTSRIQGRNMYHFSFYE